MMKKILLMILSCCVYGLALQAAVPAWFYRNSDARFLVGNGSAQIRNKTDLVKAISQAKEDALQAISAQIYTEVRSLINSRESSDGNQSEEFYAKEVQINSCIRLCGYDEVVNDQDRNFYYVQIQIPRQKMQEHYQQLVQDEISGLTSLNQSAQAEKNARKAQKLYQQVRGKREDLNRDIMILGFLQVGQDFSEQLKNLPSIGEIDAEIQRLSTNRTQSYEDLATDIIDQIDPALKGRKTFAMGYYEWGNSGFVSQFSSSFSAFLRASLEKQLGWSSPPPDKTPELSIFGEMAQEGDQVCIFTRLLPRDSVPKTLISYLNAATLEQLGRNYVFPKKLDMISAQDKLIKDNAQSSNKLKVDVRTGEFGKNLAVYKYGDPVSIQVRANKACWMHVYYLEADSTKTVLYENYYLADDMVNQWVTVTDELETCEPAGIEQVWVQADTGKLPDLYTYIQKINNGGTKKI